MENDLISRQAAIDALSHMCSEDENEITVSRANVCAMLKYLPSAQPEPHYDEWCYDCKEYDKEKHCCPRWNKVIRETLREVQPEIIRCKDCKYRDENWRRVSVRWLPCMDVRTGSNWYCGSADRGEKE